MNDKILLAGATGYVGGTVLSQLLQTVEPCISEVTIDLLIRNQAQADKLRDVYGERVQPILWRGLEDTAFIENVAQNYDIIVNADSGFIPEGAIGFVKGLARRSERHRSVDGHVENAGRNAVTGKPKPEGTSPNPRKEWNDEVDGERIFEYMKELDEREPYTQRATEVGVLAAAAATNGAVQAVSLNTPCIFGIGTGLFNQQGLVIPLALQYIVRHGCGFKLNDTANFDWIHIEDLASYYVCLIRTILTWPDRGVGYIPSNTRGVHFPTNGRTLVTEINQMALDVAFEAGVLPREGTPKTKEIPLKGLKEIAEETMAGREDVAERGWGGHKAARGTLGRKLLGQDEVQMCALYSTRRSDEVRCLMLRAFRSKLIAIHKILLKTLGEKLHDC